MIGVVIFPACISHSEAVLFLCLLQTKVMPLHLKYYKQTRMCLFAPKMDLNRRALQEDARNIGMGSQK